MADPTQPEDVLDLSLSPHTYLMRVLLSCYVCKGRRLVLVSNFKTYPTSGAGGGMRYYSVPWYCSVLFVLRRFPVAFNIRRGNILACRSDERKG